MLNLWPLAAFAGGVTIVLAAVLGGARRGHRRRGRRAAGSCTCVEILGKLSDTVAAVDWLSAFHYYGSAIEDGIRPAAFAGLLGAGLALTVLGAWLLDRRDAPV